MFCCEVKQHEIYSTQFKQADIKALNVKVCENYSGTMQTYICLI